MHFFFKFQVMLIGTQFVNLGFQLEAVQIMLIMCYIILTTIIEMVFIKMVSVIIRIVWLFWGKICDKKNFPEKNSDFFNAEETIIYSNSQFSIEQGRLLILKAF